MRLYRLLFLAVVLAAIGMSPSHPTRAAQRCFAETSQCIDGRIAEFWDKMVA